MKVERFKIGTLYRNMALEGVCRVIYPSTFMITMELPYKGLSKAEHFFDNGNGTFAMENIKSRAIWDLGRLYEQYQDIRCNYVRYKKMMEEWEQYEHEIENLKDEATICKQSTDKDNVCLIDFYLEALYAGVSRHFDEMTKRYGIMPLSLSPSVLRISLELIDKEFENQQSKQIHL